ncbi:chemotaxis protein CheB [Limnohabitans sp. Jir72]|nr:chemotaxis protein CheB [Limnohabitans sp. Jir72]
MSDLSVSVPARDGPRIVGIGASAGGLSAMEAFFAHVPLDTDCAYVVVQHMAPDHPSLLGTLLQRVTALPVSDAQDGVVLLPNTVHVMACDGALTVVRGCLHFRAAHKVPGLRGPHLPIDGLLTSLAQDQGERAVGVVLSGMGRDGVQGLQAIYNTGGLTLAQQPDTAAFVSMPQSAIDAQCVDVVAPPQDMPARMVQGLKMPKVKAALVQPSADAEPIDALQAIVRLLHQQHKHDLSLYKPSTLRRRVERRMHVHQLPSMAAYLEHLQTHPQELALLFSEILIGVTAFFRDPLVWSDLAEKVLPGLLQQPRTGPVRAWVLGCSTGEEAYSLAMALQEVQDDLAKASPAHKPWPVQIFATDLNAAGIAVARKGCYSAQSLAEMDPVRRDRFFVPYDGGYLIQPEIRSMVLFAQHDVIQDPPFTQLDLLLCRNVLIYFNAALQRRLMPLFHFSLRPAGVLVLGSAETVGRSQSLFAVLHPKSRIYRRNEQTLLPGSVDFPIQRSLKARAAVQELSVPMSASNASSNLQSLADQVLLQTFSPAAVLVNATGDILYISGRTGRYLEPAAGKANWNVHVMLRHALRAQVAMALRQALQERQPVVLHGLPLEGDGQRQLQVTVQPLQEPQALAGMAMLVFKEVAAPGTAGSASALPNAALVDELQSAREEIQALRHEMQASKEEMHALNESMQTANEELQSSNEELTTSKEEAQSMNEELQTINGELQTRLDDLALAQSDMQNLLNSTDIATLFLDNDLNVRRYTEQAVGIFHLREADVGRPLSDLASTLDYPQLQTDVKETLRTLASCAKSVVASDGRWFSVRIMPYRTLANMIQGAVLTFVDISAAKALEFRLREAHAAAPPAGAKS